MGYVVGGEGSRKCAWCSIRTSPIHGLGWFAERDFAPYEGLLMLLIYFITIKYLISSFAYRWEGVIKQPGDPTEDATMSAMVGGVIYDACRTGPP